MRQTARVGGGNRDSHGAAEREACSCNETQRAVDHFETRVVDGVRVRIADIGIGDSDRAYRCAKEIRIERRPRERNGGGRLVTIVDDDCEVDRNRRPRRIGSGYVERNARFGFEVERGSGDQTQLTADDFETRV